MRTSNVCQRPFKAIKDHLKVFLTTLYSFFNAAGERLMCLTDDPLSIVICESLEHLLFHCTNDMTKNKILFLGPGLPGLTLSFWGFHEFLGFLAGSLGLWVLGIPWGS